MKKNNKQEIMNTLQSGICEIIFMDENGVETSLIGTTAKGHLPLVDVQENLNHNSQNSITIFNVNTEQWENFQMVFFESIEQLTGEGAECNEKKLQAGTEYMESIMEMTASDELDTMEHPEEGIE